MIYEEFIKMVAEAKKENPCIKYGVRKITGQDLVNDMKKIKFEKMLKEKAEQIGLLYSSPIQINMGAISQLAKVGHELQEYDKAIKAMCDVGETFDDSLDNCIDAIKAMKTVTQGGYCMDNKPKEFRNNIKIIPQIGKSSSMFFECKGCQSALNIEYSDLLSTVPFDEMKNTLERCGFKVYTEEQNQEIVRVKNFIDAVDKIKATAKAANLSFEETISLVKEIYDIVEGE